MTRCTTKKRAPLTRDRVLRAALELADQGGTQALTMQRIGRRLGVEAMSLYRPRSQQGRHPRRDRRPRLRRDRAAGRSLELAHDAPCQIHLDPRGPAPASLGDQPHRVAADAWPGQSPRTRGHPDRPARRRVLGGHGDPRLQPRRRLRARVRAAGGEPPVQRRRRAGRHERGDPRQPAGGRIPELCSRRDRDLTSGFDYAEEFEFGLDLILDAIGPVIAGSLIARRPVKRARPTAGPNVAEGALRRASRPQGHAGGVPSASRPICWSAPALTGAGSAWRWTTFHAPSSRRNTCVTRSSYGSGAAPPTDATVCSTPAM